MYIGLLVIFSWSVSLYYQLSDIPAHFACPPRLAQRLRLSAALVTRRIRHIQHPVSEGCQYIFLTRQLCVNPRVKIYRYEFKTEIRLVRE